MHTIRLDHLQLALASAKLRRWNGGRTARFAAMSGNPSFRPTCRNARRWGRSPAFLADLNRPWFTAMDRGDLLDAIHRTQRERGGREVRRIWGQGFKALCADSVGDMR